MQQQADAKIAGPTLDRDSEPWLGRFPGLGTIRVGADGGIEVAVETDSPGAEAALRRGWAEHLSWFRTGGRLSHSTTMVPPDDDRALLLNGDNQEMRVVVRELLDREWQILSDQPSRLRVDEELVAHPRPGLIIPMPESDGFTGEPVRDDTDATLVEVAQYERPARVAGVATIRGRAPGHGTLEEVTGQRRFEAATRLLVRGVFSHDEIPAEQKMAEHLALTRIPMCTVLYKANTEGDPIASLLEWWSQL